MQDLGDTTPVPPGCVKAWAQSLRSVDMTPLDDLILTDDAGDDVALRDLWAERPAALVFLRHYG